MGDDRRKYFMIKSPQKNVTDPGGGGGGGGGGQPPDHQWDAHPTEPPRPTDL